MGTERRPVLARLVGTAALVVAVSLAGACGRIGKQDDKQSGEPPKRGGPVCDALGDFRMGQFAAQSLATDAPEQEKAPARQLLLNGAERVSTLAPDLEPATARLVRHVTEAMEGRVPPDAEPGQLASVRRDDAEILEYQKRNCPDEAWGGVAPAVLANDGSVPEEAKRVPEEHATPAGTSQPAGTPTGEREGNGQTGWPGENVDTTKMSKDELAVWIPPPFEPPRPAPLPWKRTYLNPAPWPDAEQAHRMRLSCWGMPERGLGESKSAGPKIAVLGDSAANLIRTVALQDPVYHWGFASHCGERFGTVIDDGRLEDAIKFQPDALVIFLGSNNTTEAWGLRPDLMDKAMFDLDRLLDATDSVRCRVVVDLPAMPHPDLGDVGGSADKPDGAELRVKLTRQVNDALHAAASRPGVHLANYAELAERDTRKYYWDQSHPTPAGINLWMNLVIETAQKCFATPPPTQEVSAVIEADNTVVNWTPAPGDPSQITYTVERSDGKTITASEPSATFDEPALEDPGGNPVRFRVRTLVVGGSVVSQPSEWVEVVEGETPWVTIVAVSLLVVAAGGLVLAVVRTRARAGGAASDAGGSASETVAVPEDVSEESTEHAESVSS